MDVVFDDPSDDEDMPTPVAGFDVQAFAREYEAREGHPLTVGGSPEDEVRRLELRGDAEGALAAAEKALADAPDDPEAVRRVKECRVAVEEACLKVLGSAKTILCVAYTADELRRVELDSVSAFLLSRIDGVATIDDLLDVAGLPRLVALRHLRYLCERRIVEEAET